MKVLIGTDGSEHAIAAARSAMAVLAAPDTVTLACVIEPPALATAGMESGFAGGIATPDAIDRAWADVKATAEVAIDRTRDAFSTEASIERVIIEGEPGVGLCQLADTRSADVIVVGSRGLGAIRRALLGSVSTHVVNNAPCPVLVVPPDD